MSDGEIADRVLTEIGLVEKSPRPFPLAGWAWLSALGIVVLLAAGLRLWLIVNVPGNVFYDAAVRSMSSSWHDFFFGALEPGGTVSVDKPPVDLWLQVAATSVLGFGPVGLHLPEALGGVAACALLFGALHRPFGVPAALSAALALAVLPASVLTARSDTMDSVLAALEVAALWCSWCALESGRMRWSLLAGALMGLAFNVKLAETLIALPALALLWLWAAAPGTRVRVGASVAGVFLAVALSWTAIASLTPVGERPFPIGSADGSIWNVTFVYNGLDRLSSQGATVAKGGAGPLRLLSAGPMQYWTLIGLTLLAATLLLLLALSVLLSRDLGHVRCVSRTARGRFAIAIVVWFATGLVLFSAMERLQVRYLEAFAPAVCAVLGVSLGVLWRIRPPLRRLQPAGDRAIQGPGFKVTAIRVLLACLAVGLLVISLNQDADLIARDRSDSAITDFSTPALSHYLRSHNGTARYEVASDNVDDVVGLVARAGLPVLVLNSVDGSLVSTPKLRVEVTRGAVRFYFAPHDCHLNPRCPGNERWAYTHSTPVAGHPGLRRLYPAPST